MSGLPSEATGLRASRIGSFVPIQEIPDATLRRRQKQRSYSGVQSDRTRNAMYGCERTGRCSVPCRTRRQVSSRAGFGREFDETITLPNGCDASMT
jgi:hypothetical protein